MKFCTLTLGCKVNQVETLGMEEILAARGHTLVGVGEGCDVCIVNTCTVTAESAGKSRRAVRRMRRLEPDALIAACGCLSELEPGTALAAGADIIGGSGGRESFALEIERMAEHRKLSSGDVSHREVIQEGVIQEGVIQEDVTQEHINHEDIMKTEGEQPDQTQIANPKLSTLNAQFSTFEELPPASSTNIARTRAILKIQDGCGNYCAYCIIPYARGHSRSLPPERVIKQAKELGERGFREIIVTGIEISSYGRDLCIRSTDYFKERGQTAREVPGAARYVLPDTGVNVQTALADVLPDTGVNVRSALADVLRGISTVAPGVRIRLGSLDPGMLDSMTVREFREIPGLCNHFHISLQSGCDDTLSRMGRRYSTEDVLASISALRSSFADCGITADLIVGFPGETEEEFAKTIAFIRKAAFSDMHIFPYSMRTGTRAADMPGQIAKSIKTERARIAADTAADMALQFRQSQVGKTVNVLFERKRDGYWIGHTSNYIEAAVKNGGPKNSISQVMLTSVENGIVIGASNVSFE